MYNELKELLKNSYSPYSGFKGRLAENRNGQDRPLRHSSGVWRTEATNMLVGQSEASENHLLRHIHGFHNRRHHCSFLAGHTGFGVCDFPDHFYDKSPQKQNNAQKNIGGGSRRPSRRRTELLRPPGRRIKRKTPGSGVFYYPHPPHKKIRPDFRLGFCRIQAVGQKKTSNSACLWCGG